MWKPAHRSTSRGPGTGTRSGQPLPARTRQRLERAMRVDLAHVRVHTDAQTARTAARVGAPAFSEGHDIGVHPAHYRPGTLATEALLAHEAAHVAQRQHSGASASDAALEHEADAMASHALLADLRGKSSAPGLSGAGPGMRMSGCTETKLGHGMSGYLDDEELKLVRGYLTEIDESKNVGSPTLDALETSLQSSSSDLALSMGGCSAPEAHSFRTSSLLPKDDVLGTVNVTPDGWASEFGSAAPSWANSASNSAVLFHELVHAYYFFVKKETYGTISEDQVVGLGPHYDEPVSENAYRIDMGMPVRTYYDEGTNPTVPTASTFSWTPTKSAPTSETPEKTE